MEEYGKDDLSHDHKEIHTEVHGPTAHFIVIILVIIIIIIIIIIILIIIIH